MDVVTLTGNLLAEWTFDIDELSKGRTHRAAAMSFQVGGKGFNVSRVLKRFGRSTEALGFAGGEMGAMCSQWLTEKDEAHCFFALEDGVRPGIVVREEDTGSSETTFLGKDLLVTKSAWQAACQHVVETRPKWLAITGSIPGWQQDWIEDLHLVLEAGIQVCADTYGPALADLVRLPLELVKINQKELAQLVPNSQGSVSSEPIQQLRNVSPVLNWIITDGPKTVTANFSCGERFVIYPAKIKEVSATGSGDTFLAALLDAWMNGLDHAEMLRFASACATANAASPGIGDFKIPLPASYYPEMCKV